MNRSRRATVRALLAGLLVARTAPHVSIARAKSSPRFAFGAFGDMPYLPGEEGIVAQLIEDMNAEALAFVVHVGDIKASWTRCHDRLYAERRDLFARSRHPIVVLPGDNDWVDCATPMAGSYDPLDRLALFRQVFHAGAYSLGERTMAIERQSADVRFAEYAENIRWRFGDVLFVGVNVTGSNNNLGYGAEGDAEHRRRSDAVNAWLAQSFGAARRDRARGVVVFMQANPGLDGKARPLWRPDGFAEIRGELARHALAFAKPVLLVHGDTHRFRVDTPLVDPTSRARVGNLTRVEVFGTPRLGWVRVTVDVDSRDVFQIAPVPYRVTEQ